MEQNQAGGKDPKREELKRTIKFVLFSISAGAIEIGVFTEIHIVVDYLQYGALIARLVFEVPHRQGLELLGRETALV